MKVGELFVELGIKGADKFETSLNGLKKGLQAIATETLTAIGLVTGLVYAFTKLAEASGGIGAGLQKFSNLTGESLDALQRWQYILQQSNVNREDVTKSFESLQSAMAKIKLLDAPPSWLQFMTAAENIDVNKWTNIPYMLQKIREFAQDPRIARDVRRQMLTEMGTFSQDMIGGLETNKLNPNTDVPAWAIRSDKEIQKLATIEAAWRNFYDQLGRLRDKFVEKYSGKMLGELTKDLKILGEFGTTLGKISDSLGDNGLKAVGVGLLAIFNPLAAAVLAIVWGLNEIRKFKPELFQQIIHPADTVKAMMGDHKLGGGMMQGFGLGDTTYNIDMHVTSPKPEEAGRHTVKAFTDLVRNQKNQVKGAYQANPRKNEY